jgi:hypothetical protein
MKGYKAYIFSVSLLLILYIVAQYNKPKPIDWTQTFSNKDKIPFGTYVVYNRLNDIFPKASIRVTRDPLYNVIVDQKTKNSTYLIICKTFKINEYDYKKLTDYVKQGNDVFISASFFGDELEKNLKVETNFGLSINSSAKQISFTNKSLDTSKRYITNKDVSDSWFSSIDTNKAFVLGKDNLQHINFVRYQLGKGNIFLNCNPLLFTNYSVLSNNDGMSYAATALSVLKNTPNVIFDQYYALGKEGEDSPFRVLLANAYLRTAFYISLFALVVFVIFEIKRRQRIIPTLEVPTNDSLAFVTTVGQVYYEQRDNANITSKKIIYLLGHFRTRYSLKTTKLDSEFIQTLAQKTGIADSFATELVDHINYLNVQPKVSDKDLIVLNQLIEKFYTETGYHGN